MKILFISHNFFPAIGGIEVNSEILATAFAEAGHEVRLVTWTADPEGVEFPFQIFRKPDLLTLFKLHSWTELIFENNPTLRLSWPNLFFPRPQVIAVRTLITRTDGTTGIQDFIKKKWLKKAGKVIAVSEAIRTRCYLEAVVIGNPYRVTHFKILKGISRCKHFVLMGRLVSDKGVDLAIRAVQKINQKKTVKHTLSIIGDGPERKMLENLTCKLKMEEYVHFTGVLRGPELTTCLNEHQYILIPSRCEEAFGNVALEGMACGCIPVASNGGGLPDAVGNAGLIFERGNLEDLINVLERLLENPNLAESLRKNAQSHLNSHHPKTISSRYLEVIDSAFLSYRKQVV